MKKRHATAIWKGTGKEGNGSVTTESTLLHDAAYSFSTRFEEGSGTNPEELVAAAHSGCFSMKLAFNIDAAGHTADKIETRCEITLNPDKGAVTHSHLTVKASVPGMSEDDFNEAVDDAKNNCPISKLLNAEISVDAKLG